MEAAPLADWVDDGRPPEVHLAHDATVLERRLWRAFCRLNAARRLAVLAFLAYATVMGLAGLYFAASTLAVPFVFGKDVIQEYILARAVISGTNPYLPVADLAARFVGDLPQMTFPHATPHPPPLGLLLAPLALFDYPTAATLWLGFELVSLAALGAIIMRALGLRASPFTAVPWVVIMVAWHPVSAELRLGQLMIPLAVLLAGGWLAWKNGEPATAGALVGLATLAKVVAWPLVLLFLLRRDRRALSASVVVLAAGYLAALAVSGPEALWTYLASLPGVSEAYRGHWNNIALFNVGTRLFMGTSSPLLLGLSADPIFLAPSLARAVDTILPVGALVLVVWLGVRAGDDATAYAIAVCGAILLSPIAWDHYLIMILVPAAQLWINLARGRHLSRAARGLLIAAAIFIVFPHSVLQAIAYTVWQADANGDIAVPTAYAGLTVLTVVGIVIVVALLASQAGGVRQRAVTGAASREPSLGA